MISPGTSERTHSHYIRRDQRRGLIERKVLFSASIAIVFNISVLFYILESRHTDRTDRVSALGARVQHLPSKPRDMYSNYSSRQLRIVWDLLGDPCTGFGQETTNLVLGLSDIENLRVISSSPKICDGLTGGDAFTSLASKNISSWNVIDVFISHKPASQFPTFPYREWDSPVHIPRHPRYLVGRTMHEVLNISAEWVYKMNNWVDEVWVPTKLCQDTFISNGVEPSRVFVLPEAIDCELYNTNVEPFNLDGKKEFNFLSIFKWEPRKGYDVLIKAFILEFSLADNVALHIKTSLMSEESRRPHNIRLIIKKMNQVVKELGVEPVDMAPIHVVSGRHTAQEILQMYKACDAYVQPTRGEGWGLPIMEAMAMGLPAIATEFGGQSEFMTKDNSYPIPISGFSQAGGPCCFESWQLWAEPSLNETRRLMRHVYNNREEARGKGALARKQILSNYCRHHVAKITTSHLDRIARQLAAREASLCSPTKY